MLEFSVPKTKYESRVTAILENTNMNRQEVVQPKVLKEEKDQKQKEKEEKDKKKEEEKKAKAEIKAKEEALKAKKEKEAKEK